MGVLGKTTAWGYPIAQLGNQISPIVDNQGRPYTYQLGLSSVPPSFSSNGTFQSVLPSNAFGKNVKSVKNVKRKKKGTLTLRQIDKDLKYLSKKR